MKINCLIFVFIQFIWTLSYSQTQKNNKKDSIVILKRGTLLLEADPFFLNTYISEGQINLKHVREICNFLTNENIINYKSFPIPKRNKAFIRHIKHINEKIEKNYLDSNQVNSEIIDLFFELELLYQSYLNKCEANAKPTISFNEKVKMKFHSTLSPYIFRYSKKISKHEAKNINKNKLEEDPLNSPYWHNNIDRVPLEKRFSSLAKLKKIKTENHMVVVFEKTSLSGSSPKINVIDLDRDNKWSLKWGDEVHTDVVGSHIFAALGYDVDHPYYYGENKLTLIFNGNNDINDIDALKVKIKEIFKVDLEPFISESGIINKQMADSCNDLVQFIGKSYVKFFKCAVEGRPDRVKRIGSFIPNDLGNEDRRELRGALLAHQLIGNWDTKESNTLLTTIHQGNFKYRVSGVFSDLGTSFGVSQSTLPPDIKVGVVNEFEWEVATRKGKKIKLKGKINSILGCYKKATYYDLLWMAKKISMVDSLMLRSMVKKGNWPEPISELYFHKLASRRASILRAFEIVDTNPISFNKHLTIIENGIDVIRDGKLVVDYKKSKNPESFLQKKGRLRNYGN